MEGWWGGNLHPLWRALLHSHTTGDCPSVPPSSLSCFPPSLPSSIPRSISPLLPASSIPHSVFPPSSCSQCCSLLLFGILEIYTLCYALLCCFFQNAVIFYSTCCGKCAVFDIGSIKIPDYQREFKGFNRFDISLDFFFFS